MDWAKIEHDSADLHTILTPHTSFLPVSLRLTVIYLTGINCIVDFVNQWCIMELYKTET